MVTLATLTPAQLALCDRLCACLCLPAEPPSYFQAYLAERLAQHDPALSAHVLLMPPGEVRALYDALREGKGKR